MENYNEIVATFVAKCNESANLSNSSFDDCQGKTVKQQKNILDSMLRSYSKTIKLLRDYYDNSTDDERNRTDGLICKARLSLVFDAENAKSIGELCGLDSDNISDAALVLAMIKQFTPAKVDGNGRICKPLNCQAVTDAIKAATEKTEAASGKNGKAKKTAEAEALKAWGNVDALCGEIQQGIEAAGFVAKVKENRCRGALVPVAKWSPGALCDFIKSAGFEAQKALTKALKEKRAAKEADEAAKTDEAMKRKKEAEKAA